MADDQPDAHLQAALDSFEKRRDLCEWNPHTGEAATWTEGCERPAAVIVGAKGEWRLCHECASLPQFKRYRTHKPIRATGPKRSP